MRLFIAIELEPNIKNALLEIQGNMKKAGVTGNYTAIDNTHITLAFIGDYPDPDYVLQAMENVSFKPFNISLKGFGNFGDLWWAGLDNSEELRTVVRSLRHYLSDAEIPYDRKKFSPHITLIRKVVCRNGMPGISIPHKSMTVNKITLYRSDRGKHGMIYTELGSV